MDENWNTCTHVLKKYYLKATVTDNDVTKATVATQGDAFPNNDTYYHADDMEKNTTQKQLP